MDRGLQTNPGDRAKRIAFLERIALVEVIMQSAVSAQGKGTTNRRISTESRITTAVKLARIECWLHRLYGFTDKIY